LTTEDVEVGVREVRLHLGNAPVQLPEPVAQPARAVAANRKGHATIGALELSPWLFSGGRPGTADQHHIAATATERPRHPPQPGPQHRSLPARYRDPAAILARALGIHTDVAEVSRR